MNPPIGKTLEKAKERPGNLTRGELRDLLALQDPAPLFAAAYAVKLAQVGKGVSIRGLIELGNQCAQDCFYCGIRRGNAKVERYRLSVDDVERMARWCWEHGYGSVVLQSGEIESAANTAYIEEIIRRLRAFGGDELGITLSLGEQTEEVYARWRAAGAHRYLLRIETSSPELYAQLHPADHSHARRLECLRALKRLGYQTGSGVMCGLPGQTVDDLARDVELFRELDLDMIGMGPYIPHPDTPLGRDVALTPEYAARQLRLGLKLIAATRLYLHDVNIAATTALQALDDRGREQGILAGANVLMPNATDVEFRDRYQLYAGKPCREESADACRGCLDRRVASIGENVKWGVRGDSPHYGKGKKDETRASN